MGKACLKPLSQENQEFILANYKKMGRDLLAETLGVSPYRIKMFLKERGLKSGLRGTFPVGHISYTQGKHMEDYIKTPEALARAKANRFKKGNIPYDHVEIGTETIRASRGKRYIWVKVAEPNVWKMKQRLVCEQIYGRELSEKDIVIFVDGDTTNCDPNNLRLVSRLENLVLNDRNLRSADSQLSEVGIGIAKLAAACYRRTKDESKSGITE